MRWRNSFHDAFGFHEAPQDFDRVWCVWDYIENRVGVIDQVDSIAQAFLNEVQVYPTTDEDSVTEELMMNWGLSIFYEQSFDAIELDYSPHGEIDPEDLLFAIPRPTVGYITYDKEPEDFYLLPQIYEPKEIWHSNRVETLRHRTFLGKHYVTFRDALYASDRDARKDWVVPDYGYHLDDWFFDKLFKKDHVNFLVEGRAHYGDFWWYTRDLAYSLIFDKAADVQYEPMTELLDTDLPSPFQWVDIVICDLIHERVFTPFEFQTDNYLAYPPHDISSLPVLFDYEFDPEYDPTRKFEEDDYDYIVSRYDYYSRLEFIDSRAVFLVEEFIDYILDERDVL